jgi:hypothetical protein
VQLLKLIASIFNGLFLESSQFQDWSAYV